MPSQNDPQAVLDSLQRELYRIDQEIEAGKSREQDVMRDADAVRRRSVILKQMVRGQSHAVEGLRDSIAALEAELEPQNVQLADLGTRLLRLEDEQHRVGTSLARSLLAERRLTDWASLEFLLGSHSWRDLLARRELLKRLQITERQSLATLNALSDTLQTAENQIFENARALRERKSDLELSQGQASAQEQNLLGDLQKLEDERTALVEHLRELRHERKILAAQRREISEAQQQIEHMIDRAARRAPIAGTPLYAMKGVLPWPVSGEIVERFGLVHNRALATVTENPGIDLTTSSEADVISVAEGRVSSVTWLRGYGNVCIVEHPGAFYTVYAKLDRVFVRASESVQAGAILGRPALDNSTNDYRVHFELWSGKEKKDPIEWLRPR